MSKFFYKGGDGKMQDYSGKAGFSTNRTIKPGSELNPLSLCVQTEERKSEIEGILQKHELFATIKVDENVEENTTELDSLVQTPKTVTTEKTPNRNEPCSCGSGKKYKKCCG